MRPTSALSRAAEEKTPAEPCDRPEARHDDPPADLDDAIEQIATQLHDPVDRYESRSMLGSWIHVADERYASAHYSYVVAW